MLTPLRRLRWVWRRSPVCLKAALLEARPFYGFKTHSVLNITECSFETRQLGSSFRHVATMSVLPVLSESKTYTPQNLVTSISQAVVGKRIEEALRDYKTLLDLFPSPTSRGHLLGRETLKALLTYCCRQGYVEVALAVFEDATQTEDGLDVEMAEGVLSLFALKGRAHEGVTLLHRMIQHDVHVGVKAAAQLVKAIVPSRDAKAIRTMIATVHEILPYFRPDDPIMYSTIISELLRLRPPAVEAAASFVLELDNARKSREHEHGSPDEGQRSRRLPPVAYLALIDYYSVIGDVDSSVEILSSLANRRDVDHGLITGHVGRVTQAVCDHKGIEEAITFRKALIKRGLDSGFCEFPHLITACCDGKRFDVLEKVLVQLPAGSISEADILPFAFKKLVDAHEFKAADKLLDRIRAHSEAIHTYSVFSSVVAYLCREGQVSAALRIFHVGINASWRPPVAVCELLLWCLLRACQWKDAEIVLSVYESCGYPRLSVIHDALSMVKPKLGEESRTPALRGMN